MLRKANLAYLAGLIDGEGSIGVSRGARGQKAFFPRLLVSGTDEILADWLVGNFGGSVTWRRQINLRWKSEFLWRVTYSRAVNIISACYDYLVLKWPQAFLALSLQMLKEQDRKYGRLISLGYRKGHTYSKETQEAFAFISVAMKAFNTRGTNAPSPWDYVHAVMGGAA